MTVQYPYYRSYTRGSCRAKPCIKAMWMLSIVLFVGIVASAQTPAHIKDNDTMYLRANNGEFDEILITLNVPRIGSTEIPALILREIAYLPVKELFDYLKIRNIVSNDFNSVEGFFIDPNIPYSINKIKGVVQFKDRSFNLQAGDFIITETGLYLHSELFSRIFSLDCRFSFRNLSVNLLTNVELPALREMKLEAMRRNLNQLKGEKKADTVIQRRFSLFRLGMIDWSLMTTKETLAKSNTRVTVGMGSTIAGGEADIFLNYYSDRAFKLRDQYYFWRYINNESKMVKQVTLGKILANPSSTVYNGIAGIQINNTPTTYRRSFGTYTLSDKTEPGWTVELYVNNVLINFTKADASGFFTFEVPMVYGNSIVKLRFYGPWGEERISEQNIAIPFNFLPAREFEYSLSAGVVEDNFKSKFSRAQFNYGLNKRITIGAGMEYLSSVSRDMMPFMTASVRLGSTLFFTGEHIHGIRSKAVLSYKLPSNLRFELNYLRYDKDQKAIRINYLDEKKFVVSKSIRRDKFSGFSRLTLNQFTLSNTAKKLKYNSAELLFSVIAFGISSNLTNFLIVQESGIPLAYSNLSMTFHLPRGINVLPQVQYEYTRKKFGLIKTEIEKSLFNRGYLNVSYEWDLKNNNNIVGLGFRYNLSFVQSSLATRRSRKGTTTTATARGSIMVDTRTEFVGLSNQNNVGKGGLIVAAFLDLNCNGKKDHGEPFAPGLKLKINGGRIHRNEKDSSIRVTGLDAYTSYYVELNKNSFDNIAWQIPRSTIRISIEPNHFTYVEVPVSVMGEVNGSVYLQENGVTKGLGRMIVNIYNNDSVLVTRIMTEADGYFSYLGLAPGNYNVSLDAEQLGKLKMECMKPSFPVTMRKTKDGDAVNGTSFVITRKNEPVTPVR